MKKYISFLLLLAVCLCALPACRDTEAVNAFLKAKSEENTADGYRAYAQVGSYEDAEVTEADPAFTLACETLGLTAEEAADDDGIFVIQKRTSGYGVEDLSYWGGNDNSIFPGALLKLKDRAGSDSLSALIGVARAPVTLSSDLATATGVRYETPTVETVTYSNVQAAVNRIVAGATREGAELPCKISMELKEIKSVQEVEAALGIGFDCPFLNASTAFDFSAGSSATYAVLVIKQIYYTIHVDYDAARGAYSIIDDDVTAATLRAGCPDGYVPVYVSSVSYGRIAAITISTEESFDSLSASLGISGGVKNVAEASMEAKLGNLAKRSTRSCRYFVYGGASSGQQDILTATSIDDVLTVLNAPYDPAKVVGVPISYGVSHLYDNAPAKIGFANEYYYATYRNVSGERTLTDSGLYMTRYYCADKTDYEKLREDKDHGKAYYHDGFEMGFLNLYGAVKNEDGTYSTRGNTPIEVEYVCEQNPSDGLPSPPTVDRDGYKRLNGDGARAVTGTDISGKTLGKGAYYIRATYRDGTVVTCSDVNFLHNIAMGDVAFTASFDGGHTNPLQKLEVVVAYELAYGAWAWYGEWVEYPNYRCEMTFLFS